MNNLNLQVIRESFGRVVYSHKTHEKAAEIAERTTKRVKWLNIVLTAITSGSLLSTIITNETILLYIGAVFAAFTLSFTIFQLSFRPEEEFEKNRNIAKELWYIREKYVNFLSDIMSNNLSDDSIMSKRDQLVEELKLVYKFAPQTNPRAYKLARKALKIDEELTFSNEEINHFLPDGLKLKDD